MTKRVNIGESVDIISSLPDDVLGHILSFLPTKMALGTCILSTRWRHLFPFANNLDIDDLSVSNPEKDGWTGRFIDFVDRCIMLMNTTVVDKFCLKCIHAVDVSCVNSWIGAAPLRNVREVDLNIPNRELGMEPLRVSARNTLVVLKLGTDLSLDVPASVHLPCLKILHLDSIYLPDGDSVQRVISSCPVLEDVLLAGRSMDKIRILNLSSASLKRLTIDKDDPMVPGFKLVLDAPNLRYLKYTIGRRESYILNNLRSLSEAHISTVTRNFPNKFLEGISRTESLSLSGFHGEYLPSSLYKLPSFKNLTRLALVALVSGSFLKLSVLMKLLKCFPNLEELCFDGSVWFLYLTDDDDVVPVFVPSRLKVIECKLFYYGRLSDLDDMRKIQYFLTNANALEKMWIRICCGDRFYQRAVNKLKTVMKMVKKLGRSKRCKIKITRECKSEPYQDPDGGLNYEI